LLDLSVFGGVRLLETFADYGQAGRHTEFDSVTRRGIQQVSIYFQ